MEFLDLFTLKDVFLAGTGLVIVSMMRIYYDSYVETKKVKCFGHSLDIYNSSIETSRLGLLVLSDTHEVVFANTEAKNILDADISMLHNGYLNLLSIENEEDGKSISLSEAIRMETHMPYAQLINKSEKLPVAVSIDKVNTSPQGQDYLYIVNISDTSPVNQLQEEARRLLESA